MNVRKLSETKSKIYHVMSLLGLHLIHNKLELCYKNSCYVKILSQKSVLP